jgi:hypothetical protein
MKIPLLLVALSTVCFYSCSSSRTAQSSENGGDNNYISYDGSDSRVQGSSSTVAANYDDYAYSSVSPYSAFDSYYGSGFGYDPMMYAGAFSPYGMGYGMGYGLGFGVGMGYGLGFGYGLRPYNHYGLPGYYYPYYPGFGYYGQVYSSSTLTYMPARVSIMGYNGRHFNTINVTNSATAGSGVINNNHLIATNSNNLVANRGNRLATNNGFNTNNRQSVTSSRYRNGNSAAQANRQVYRQSSSSNYNNANSSRSTSTFGGSN